MNEQRLGSIVLAPGRLEFDASVAGRSHRLWIKAVSEEAAEQTPHADSALALGLMPAMREGGVLRVDGDVSPRVLRMQEEFQGIQLAWSQGWPFEGGPLREVSVEAGRRPAPTPGGTGRVACFFSGGIDSWASVLSDPEITDLIFVKGADILPSLSTRHVGLGERVEESFRELAKEMGKQLHVVEINVREFSEDLIHWAAYFNSPLCAVALFFESRFDRVLIPTDSAYASQAPLGASRLVDGLWSSEGLEIFDHGSRQGRFERTRLVAESPLAQRSLRVCYMNYDRAYNCGRCPKCNVTLIALEALGVRDRFSTFPDQLDFTALEDYTPAMDIVQLLWEELLQGIEGCEREDLAQVVRPLVERGARHLADPAMAAAQQEATASQAQLREVLGSTSWRLTAPLRRAGRAVRRARHR